MKYVYAGLISILIVWCIASTYDAVDRVNTPIINTHQHNVTAPQQNLARNYHATTTSASAKVFPSSDFETNPNVDLRLGYSVEEKYRDLLNYLDFSSSPDGKKKLLLLLQNRELAESGYSQEGVFLDASGSFANQTQHLLDIDADIIELLSTNDREKYQILKNSSAQQTQLADFYQLYPASANIPAKHKTKLLYEKTRFELVLTDAINTDKALIDDVSSANKKPLVETKINELLAQQDAYLSQIESLLPQEDIEMFKLTERDALKKYLTEIYDINYIHTSN